jgi:hypothetical protein
MTDIKEIKRKFFNSHKLGTGEVYLILKENPEIDFSNQIIKAAVRNYAFDPQCENRAWYINNIIKKTKQKDKIINKVLHILNDTKYDNHEYALDLLCNLTVLFYKNGYEQAKIILYQRAEKNVNEDYPICGFYQLIEMDGLSGLLKVAEITGKIISKDADFTEDGWMVDSFQARNKRIDVYSELEQAGRSNKFIKLFYQTISGNKVRQPKRKKKTYNYETITVDIINNKRLYLTEERVNSVSNEDFEKLAKDFLTEKGKSRKEKYLYIFSKRKFPFDYKYLFKIVMKPNPRDTRIVEYALEALQYFKSEEIRSLVINKLKGEKFRIDYLPLLVSNYQEGDAELLCKIANKSTYTHALNYIFADIYKANMAKECREPLEIIYNKMNCGICRINIIETLAKNGVLSTHIFRELQYDCDKDVRSFYKKNKQTYEHTIKRIE